MQIDLFEPGLADILQAESYEDFKNKLAASQCSKCPELCRERHNIVVDRGNSKTKLVLIGEAPGEKEDLEGNAFVGRAGKLLDQMMASIGLDTNKDMAILNVVKCRPPGNRAPKPIEVENCFPYLKWQLDFIKPQLVVLLGATAAKHFIQDKKASMKDLVGKIIEVASYPNSKFMLLYHPAFLLRDPRKKPETWEHLKKMKQHLIGEGNQ